MSMLITGGILVVLGMIGGRPRGGEAEWARDGRDGRDGRSLGMGGSLPVAAEMYINPLEPPPKAEWEVLTGCELVRTPTNSAHHFRVMWDGKPMVFELYFVETPEVTEPDDDRVADQARYFGWPDRAGPDAWTARSVDIGEQAWKSVEERLEGGGFLVLTKFERRTGTHHYFAVVVIEDGPGRRRTLQEWLVEQGYGMITRPSLGWLPMQIDSEQFIERLEHLQVEAQRARKGGWGGLAVR